MPRTLIWRTSGPAVRQLGDSGFCCPFLLSMDSAAATSWVFLLFLRFFNALPSCVFLPLLFCLPYHTSGPTIAGIVQLTQQQIRYHSCLILWLHGHAVLRCLAFCKLLSHVVFMFSCGDGKVVSACAINFGQAFLMQDRVRLVLA